MTHLPGVVVTEISLVIPAHNEAENLPALFAACFGVLDELPGDHELVLIEDGSTDDSRAVVERAMADEPRLQPIWHEPGHNIGCHPSELAGLKRARGRIMVFLPADLQVHPDTTPAFVNAARDADVVASNRVARTEGPWRRLLSSLNNRLERALMGVDVHDAHSAMALTRRAVDLLCPQISSSSALIPAELLVRARGHGLRIAEIEVEHFPRVAGRPTGVKPSEIIRVPPDLARLRVRLAREQRG
jgi:glycosyltransferase involved in cell wall biosynthesis